MAYGTDKHPDYVEERGTRTRRRPAAGDLHDRLARAGSARRAGDELEALRADLDGARGEAGRRARERRSLMEILLLGIYSFFVWLIFIKLKLLPWTTPWKVAVAIFPIVASRRCSCC